MSSFLQRRTAALFITVAIAVAGLLAAGTIPSIAAIGGSRRPKPTVVLVHGAFADSSSFNGVIADLRAKGYPVLAAANPLRGLRSDAAYVAQVLDRVPGPIVLVGHSYGGAVITNAATGNPRVKALVYLAAFAPDRGETAAELAGRYPGGTLGSTLVQFPLADGGTDLYIQQDKFRAQFAHDVPAAQATVMAAAQRPITAAALNEPSGDPAWRSVPSWFLIPTGDKNIPAAGQRFMAERAGSRIVEVPNASHAVTVSRPAAVTRLIIDAAR